MVNRCAPINFHEKEEGKFVWEDGCTSSYTNWDAGPPQEPNNDPNYRGEDCTIKWNDGTVWNDVPCDFTYPCYCQAVKGGGTRSVSYTHLTLPTIE